MFSENSYEHFYDGLCLQKSCTHRVEKQQHRLSFTSVVLLILYHSDALLRVPLKGMRRFKQCLYFLYIMPMKILQDDILTCKFKLTNIYKLL